MNFIGDEYDHLEQGRAAHERAMRAPVLTLNDHDAAEDEQRRTASQLGIPEWTAIAFFVLSITYALLRGIGATE